MKEGCLKCEVRNMEFKKHHLKKGFCLSQAWWYTSVNPALGNQKQRIMSSRPA
jgi:hypothetical protein